MNMNIHRYIHIYLYMCMDICLYTMCASVCRFVLSSPNHDFTRAERALSGHLFAWHRSYQLWGVFLWRGPSSNLMPVAGSKLLEERISILQTFSRNCCVRILFWCVHSSGLRSGLTNLTLQSLVNQCFLQTFEWFFPKKKPARRSPWGWSARIWRENLLKWIHFTRLLGLLWHYLKKLEELKILFLKFGDQNFFRKQMWSCDQCKENAQLLVTRKIGDSGVKSVILKNCQCTTYCSTS